MARGGYGAGSYLRDRAATIALWLGSAAIAWGTLSVTQAAPGAEWRLLLLALTSLEDRLTAIERELAR